jgi:A/G-specific adenine glycosylase
VSARSGGRSFAARIVAWQAARGRRELPCQGTRDPYRVWLSEVMLQQTQVATVIPYYARFCDRFPDVTALAAAPLADVLSLWAGLGYYARARNLHACARLVVENFGGSFPLDARALARLPGIGRSTAAAIAAFCTGAREPILDGNVKRVLARYFAVSGFPGEPAVEKRLWSLADACTPQRRVGEYTQAIMDLGATVCTRSRPACLLCPLAARCVARAQGLEDKLPAPRPRTRRPQREAWVVVARRGQHQVLLERRPPSGVWGGLWGLPEFPTRAHAEQWCSEHLSGAATAASGESLRHAFSHFDYELKPLVVRCAGKAPALRGDDRYRWYDVAAPAEVGVPKPIATLLQRVRDQLSEAVHD